MPEVSKSTPDLSARRRARVTGDGHIARLLAQTLHDDGWTSHAEAAAAEAWLFQVTSGREASADAVVADLRAFALDLGATQRGGIVLMLDLTHAQPRAGEAPPPFAPALALRTLLAAVPVLALEFAPRLRVNAIGTLPPSPSLPQGTPDADIAAALRFVIDAPALTGQMIALDGGRTALVPAPGFGTPDLT